VLVVPIPQAQKFPVVVAREGDRREAEDWIAVEEPLEIRTEAEGRPSASLAVTMRSPGNEQELAIGFLFTEGLIRDRDDLARPSVKELFAGVGPHNQITVRLARDFDQKSLTRNFYATSSCGVCGKATIDQIERAAPPIEAGPVVPARTIAAMPAKLLAVQEQFERTGGLHAVGLFSTEGDLLLAREDVGRHNAMDKAIGRLVLDGKVPARDVVALVSGRASFELVQKAAMAAIPILCAISAPSSLAVRAAQRFGMTLVGFLRDGRQTVYARPERIG
jgi:FdhD protein